MWYTAWLCYTVSCIVRNNCVASSFPPGDSFPIFVRFKPCAHICILVVFWSVSQSLRWRMYKTPHCTGHDRYLYLIITEGDGPMLLGRDWLEALRLDWRTIFRVGQQQTLPKVPEQHSNIFKQELGELKGTKAKIHVDSNVRP